MLRCVYRLSLSRLAPRRPQHLIASLFLLLTLSVSTGAVFAQGAPSWVADELLVGHQANVAREHAQALYRAAGATVLDELPELNVHRLRVPAAARDAVARALAKHPQVSFVERNFLAQGGFAPNDPMYGSQWHLPKIAAPAGWNLSTGAAQAIVAVIDSGIDPTHPDLVSKLVPGYNFVQNNNDTHDVLGHGTAVAGTAAAQADNQTGVAGVAWENAIMPLVVLDANNWATYSDIAAAITYAADMGAQVINISIGGSSSSSTLSNAVEYAWNKGVVLVASAMNDGSSTPMYPAALDHVIAVAATDQSDNRASFSNYGNWIGLAAPGVSILTTTNGGGYGSWSGTSFASPIVAGLAALVFAINPDLSNAQVVDLMQQYSDDLGAVGYDTSFGYGRVNIAATLLAASSSAPAPDSEAPTATITSPQDGDSVSGTVAITVSATDNIGVSHVELYVNGVSIATDTTSPYSFTWDADAAGDGFHTLTAYAYDAVGNVSSPSTVMVVVDAIAPSAPTNLTVSIVRKKVQLTWGAATDNLDMAGYTIWRDGASIAATADTSYTDNSVGSGGTYTYYVVADDAAGNESAPSNTATITVGGSKSGGGNKGGGKK